MWPARAVASLLRVNTARDSREKASPLEESSRIYDLGHWNLSSKSHLGLTVSRGSFKYVSRSPNSSSVVPPFIYNYVINLVNNFQFTFWLLINVALRNIRIVTPHCHTRQATQWLRLITNFASFSYSLNCPDRLVSAVADIGFAKSSWATSLRETRANRS